MTNRPPLLHRIASYLFGWEWHYTRHFYYYTLKIEILSGKASLIAHPTMCWGRNYYPKTNISINKTTISSYRYMPTLRKLRKNYDICYENKILNIWIAESDKYHVVTSDTFKGLIKKLKCRHWWLRRFKITSKSVK